MIQLFKPKPIGKTITFQIEGMHCVSCGMDIDDTLEETPGIISASTHFARAQTKVVFDPNVIQESDIRQVIERLKYTATPRP